VKNCNESIYNHLFLELIIRKSVIVIIINNENIFIKKPIDVRKILCTTTFQNSDANKYLFER